MKKVFIIVSVAFALLSLSCTNKDTDEIASNKTIGGVVKYEVISSTSGFLVTYKDSTGTTVQKNVASTSWTTSFNGHLADSVYVSAKADNLNSTITTKIYYKGNVMGQGSGSGDHPTAKAFGKL